MILVFGYQTLVEWEDTKCLLPSLALPPLFKEELKDAKATEGEKAVLRCELTKPDATIEWRKGSQNLKAGVKYTIRQEGALAELIINILNENDAGSYTCVCGDRETTATLTVNGKLSEIIFYFYFLWLIYLALM